ncbi:MAG: hypothetical protein SFY96_07485 [Planctomycetota bacterium]|nr:hypothetical protein [Planctomycetota bacterium]
MPLVVFGLLLSRALTRPFDLDEHQFVSPAQLLVQEGLRPYVDYPLFHTPLLVYIYAGVIQLSDNALLATRVFSAIVGTLCVMMVFWASRAWLSRLPQRQSRNIALALMGIHISARVFTYTNGWSWNHDASICAILGAVLLHLHAVRTGRVAWFIVVGALLGAAVTVRLTTAPAAGVLGLCGVLLASRLGAARRLLAGVLAFAGAAGALVPTWTLYRAAPEDFVFGNLGYPALYKSYVLEGNTQQSSLVGKIGHFFQTWCTDPGNLAALFLLGLACWLLAVRRATSNWRSESGVRVVTLVSVAFALFVGLNAPFQVQMQYHSVLLPFFLLIVAATLASVAPDGEAQTATGIVERVSRAVLIAGVVAAAINIPRWYWQVYRIATPSAWTPTKVARTADWVRENVQGQGRVLTIDPIIPLQAGLRVYPPYATGRFTFHVGKFMTPEERRARRMLWGPQLDEALAADPPAAVMYKSSLEGLAVQLKDAAEARGFERRASPDGEYTLWIPAKNQP